MSTRDGKTIIHPPAGLESLVAGMLLDLASDPNLVQSSTDTVGTGSLSFIVPNDVAEAFEDRFFRDKKKAPLVPEPDPVPPLVSALAAEEGALQPAKLSTPTKKSGSKK